MNEHNHSLEAAHSTSAVLDAPVTGMHCAACATRIEKALTGTGGVEQATVNFATQRATVHFDPEIINSQALQKVVQSQGYDVLLDAAVSTTEATDILQEGEFYRVRFRFIIAAVLTLPVVILSMGPHLVPSLSAMLDFPGKAWIELLLTTAVLFWAGREFFTGPGEPPATSRANMDTLVAVGTLAAYLFSLAITVVPEFFGHAHHGSHEVYYEVAASIMRLFSSAICCRSEQRAEPAARFVR